MSYNKEYYPQLYYMKNHNFIIAFGITIPLIVTTVLIILVNNSGNLVQTKYDLLYTSHSGLNCNRISFSVDFQTKKIRQNTGTNYCSKTSNNTPVQDELYIIDSDTGYVTKTNLSLISGYEIYPGKSPDGINYRYGYDDMGFNNMSLFGIFQQGGEESIELNKGPWQRKIFTKDQLDNYQYHSNIQILGWILYDPKHGTISTESNKTNVDTVKWKMYSNREFGFQFRYPESLSFSESKNPLCISNVEFYSTEEQERFVNNSLPIYIRLCILESRDKALSHFRTDFRTTKIYSLPETTLEGRIGFSDILLVTLHPEGELAIIVQEPTVDYNLFETIKSTFDIVTTVHNPSSKI